MTSERRNRLPHTVVPSGTALAASALLGLMVGPAAQADPCPDIDFPCDDVLSCTNIDLMILTGSENVMAAGGLDIDVFRVTNVTGLPCFVDLTVTPDNPSALVSSITATRSTDRLFLDPGERSDFTVTWDHDSTGSAVKNAQWAVTAHADATDSVTATVCTIPTGETSIPNGYRAFPLEQRTRARFYGQLSPVSTAYTQGRTVTEHQPATPPTYDECFCGDHDPFCLGPPDPVTAALALAGDAQFNLTGGNWHVLADGTHWGGPAPGDPIDVIGKLTVPIANLFIWGRLRMGNSCRIEVPQEMQAACPWGFETYTSPTPLATIEFDVIAEDFAANTFDVVVTTTRSGVANISSPINIAY